MPLRAARFYHVQLYACFQLTELYTQYSAVVLLQVPGGLSAFALPIGFARSPHALLDYKAPTRVLRTATRANVHNARSPVRNASTPNRAARQHPDRNAKTKARPSVPIRCQSQSGATTGVGCGMSDMMSGHVDVTEARTAVVRTDGAAVLQAPGGRVPALGVWKPYSSGLKKPLNS